MSKNWLEKAEEKRNKMLARKRYARWLKNIYDMEEE